MKKWKGKISLWLAVLVFALAVLFRASEVGSETVTLARLSKGVRASGESVAEALAVLGQVAVGKADFADVAAVFLEGEATHVDGRPGGQP